MERITIRLNADTVEELEEAARNAGLSRSVFIRNHLEQVFDGTPHNPLGVKATPAFYNMVCEAFATMKVLGADLDTAGKKLVERQTKKLVENLEIDYEH